jgi:hypothetical protein
MGYSTDFTGQIKIEPALSQEEIDFLTKFSNSRRMNCKQGPYYVDRGGFMGQDHSDPLIVDYNQHPRCQPGLWCKWEPTKDGNYIQWDEGEKFSNSVEWMQYLINHFIGEDPIAKKELPFLNPHKLSGEIQAQGEDYNDRWVLVVSDNHAKRVDNDRAGKTVCCPHCEEEFTLED